MVKEVEKLDAQIFLHDASDTHLWTKLFHLSVYHITDAPSTVQDFNVIIFRGKTRTIDSFMVAAGVKSKGTYKQKVLHNVRCRKVWEREKGKGDAFEE